MTDFKNDKVWLLQGDCLERMKEIPDGSVDLILTDPPYNTLKDVHWDKIIDLDLMWEQLLRILKPNGVAVFTSEQPFTSTLTLSNLDMFRYSMIWDKVNKTGFLNSSYRPLKQTEDVLVFSRGKIGSKAVTPMPYNPQGVVEVNKKKINNPNETWREGKGNKTLNNQLNNGKEYVQKFTNHPTNIISIPSNSSGNIHNTQKPVALMEYLINTYTNEGETVLDFTFGSGSTIKAALNTNRKSIGIELGQCEKKNHKYFGMDWTDVLINQLGLEGKHI